MSEVEYYQSFSDKFVDVIKEMLSFLEDPAKNYSLSTVDLFLDAIGKGMQTKVKIFQLGAKGKITTSDAALVNGYSYELYLARYSSLHYDSVLSDVVELFI